MSTSTPLSARCRLQVSVDIPIRRPSLSLLFSARAKLKENASSASVLKRKPTEQSAASSVRLAKKARIVNDASPYVYCHQCSRKRDPLDCVQCTFQDGKKSKNKSAVAQRCPIFFCRNCLHNRYNEDIESIKQSPTSNEPRFCGAEGYTFKCFKCRDECNCSRCRKTKGLAPIGNIERKATQHAELKAHVQPKVEVAVKSAGTGTDQDTQGPDKARKPRAQKPQVIPVVTWVALDTKLSPEAAEVRILIREFVARFAPEERFSRSHVEELGFITGHGRSKDDEETDWVGEPCVKAILTWLLEVLRDDTDDADLNKSYKSALSEIRSSSGNLNKMWLALSTLRNSSKKLPFVLPDPTPCPETTVVRSTRNSNEDAVSTVSYVARSYQLIPIIAKIIESILGTAVLREELDEGQKRHRELVREKQDAAKKENDRWDVIKGTETMLESKVIKSQRTHHKEVLQSLDCTLRVAVHDCTLRSGPLGVDHEGRKYWAVSPGSSDRHYAKSVLTWYMNGGRKPKRGRVAKKPTVSDAGNLTSLDWSSLVVAWGRKPSEKHGDDEDMAGESWWLFSNSEEVHNLALWLESKLSVILDGARPGKGDTQLKALISEVKDHSAILKWKERLNEENTSSLMV